MNVLLWYEIKYRNTSTKYKSWEVKESKPKASFLDPLNGYSISPTWLVNDKFFPE